MRYSFVFLLCAFSNAYAASEHLAPVFDNSTYSGGGSANRSEKPSNNSMYEIFGRLEQMQLELQQLRGLVEEQSQIINQLDKKQNNIYSDLDHRLQELTGGNGGNREGIAGGLDDPQNLSEQAGVDGNKQIETAIGQAKADNVSDEEVAANVVVPTVGAAEVVEEVVVEKTLGSQKELYQSAYEKLRNGHNTKAIAEFKQLLTAYPEGELASSSQYWLGEAYKLTNDLTAAKRAYAKVVSHYGRGSRVPDALLKLGFIELEQNNKVSARDYLSKITVRYPDSTAAHLARKKLLQMETIE